jgi:glycosyltransferase involved in cell wall biosynthesis
MDVEVILSDGGSSDGTVRIAQEHGVRVVTGGNSRGSSMNVGALEATGDILLFLHADTLLPNDWAPEVRRLLAHKLHKGHGSSSSSSSRGSGGGEGGGIGAFSFQLKEEDDVDVPCLWCVAWGTNLRSRLMALPYGDQGLFMTRATLARLGGFPAVPFMEDVDLVKRAQATGCSVTTSKLSIRTSARRWRINGVVWNTVMNQIILIGNAMGVPRDRLARWYYGLTRRKEY